MTAPVRDPERKEILDRLLLTLPGVSPGKVFGFDGYFVGGRLFACIYGSGIGIKLPEQMVGSLLAEPHIVPFQPLGKPRMREWILVNHHDATAHQDDLPLLRASVDYVRNLTPVPGRSP